MQECHLENVNWWKFDENRQLGVRIVEKYQIDESSQFPVYVCVCVCVCFVHHIIYYVIHKSNLRVKMAEDFTNCLLYLFIY